MVTGTAKNASIHAHLYDKICLRMLISVGTRCWLGDEPRLTPKIYWVTRSFTRLKSIRGCSAALLAKRAEIDAQNEELAESGKTVEWMSAWDVREVVVSKARLEDAKVKAR